MSNILNIQTMRDEDILDTITILRAEYMSRVADQLPETVTHYATMLDKCEVFYREDMREALIITPSGDAQCAISIDTYGDVASAEGVEFNTGVEI